MPPEQAAFLESKDYLLSFLLSHCWLAMPQLVLQADWQEVWHSPHPPFFALAQRFFVSIVLMCFIRVLRNLFTLELYHKTKILSICLIKYFYKGLSSKAYLYASFLCVIRLNDNVNALAALDISALALDGVACLGSEQMLLRVEDIVVDVYLALFY